jgi:hypothetical protein
VKEGSEVLRQGCCTEISRVLGSKLYDSRVVKRYFIVLPCTLLFAVEATGVFGSAGGEFRGDGRPGQFRGRTSSFWCVHQCVGGVRTP